MSLTRQTIEDKLRQAGFMATQGNCQADTTSMIQIILGPAFKCDQGPRCNSLEEALTAIRAEYGKHHLVPFWPQTGILHRTCPTWHGFIVYSITPLASFTVWPPLKFDFYDEGRTCQVIKDTLNSEHHGKAIDINRIIDGNMST